MTVSKHLFTVAVYDTSRAYGGPEEGGWWYDRGDRDDTVAPRYATSEAEADALAARFNRRQDKPNWRNSYGGRRAIVYEGPAPEHYPERRPHYE